MKKQVDFIKKNKVKEYTIEDIRTLRLIPWAHNFRTIKKIIVGSKNSLKARMVGTEKQPRYLIPATGIIKYLQTYGPALMGTIRKTKNDKRSKRETKN